MKVTLIFDIGRTNKKCFLFNEDYQEVFKEYQQIQEIQDDDGYPCDDILAIRQWVLNTYHKLSRDRRYEIKAINCSAYGASFVHLDSKGHVVTPIYNYLKPLPTEIKDQFYEQYGNPEAIAQQTASPQLDMLNSGMQLYWLKHKKPNIYSNIRWSLHLPQYLSYLFSGIPTSDYTSIGCHTNLWNYEHGDYHDWVYQEKITKILPPILHTQTTFKNTIGPNAIPIGIGIHDSSAALFPYILKEKEPFLLISTGTWSITLNPFSDGILTKDDLNHDCLNFLCIDGNPVKAARLFLGQEYKLQLDVLKNYFQKESGYQKQIAFDEAIFQHLAQTNKHYYKFTSTQLPREAPQTTDLKAFNSFEVAYHQLMLELMELQANSIKRAIGQTKINKAFIDGGFASNNVFIKLLERFFPEMQFIIAPVPLGSAMGAALVVADPL